MWQSAQTKKKKNIKKGSPNVDQVLNSYYTS